MLKKTLIALFFLYFILLVPIATAGDVSVTARGGIGVRLNVDNFSDHNITINYAVRWTDIFGRQLLPDEGYLILGPSLSWELGHIPFTPLFEEVSVYLEADGIVVEKQGFSFFIFVLLR